MRPPEAAAAMRQRATSIEVERARLSGAMRAILDLGGVHGLRAIISTEYERVAGAHVLDKDWIG
ncbi:hypothetical protein [Brevundimonas sp. Leaf363]|uniref:hypothetical protein n=1 Tax=Brevundimonas sp. Leaf363 TaxID=1736353 RepID=UPI000AB5D90A|nr:hypothetical protein [Brevundimonas sp. Leaf363]